MIETIRYLGERSLNDKNSVVEALTLPLKKEVKNNQQHVVIVNYNLNQNKIEVDLDTVNDSSPVDYIWIGSADGKNSPQWYGTVSNVEYLLNQTIPNLLERWDKEDSFYTLLSHTFGKFFIDLGAKEKKDERYRFIVNPTFFNGELNEKDPKNAKTKVAKQFQEFVKNKLNLTSDDIQIYSLAINDNLIVNQSEFHRLVLREKEKGFDESKEGICSVSGRKEMVTGNTTKLRFKYYITDKINFASGLEEKKFCEKHGDW